MTRIYISLSALSLLALSGCTDSEAGTSQTNERPPENGAQFKKGEGLSITEKMAASIGLKTAEVIEQKIASHLPLKLRPSSSGVEATGWISAAEAEKIEIGAKVEISGDPALKGIVRELNKPVSAAFGEYELVVAAETKLSPGTDVDAAIILPEADAGASIPRSALLSTAEGQFVYAKNGKYFYRTGVSVGAMNEDHVEVTEGLYAGDEVVTTPVMSLWMAELQVLRGGKACNCGH